MKRYLLTLFISLMTYSAFSVADADFSISLGLSQSNITFDSGASEVDIVDLDTEYTPLLGGNITKTLNENWRFGIGIQYEYLLDSSFVTLKAIEATYLFNSKLGLGGYLGASRLAKGLPAYGYRAGLNLAWLDLYENLDWVLEYSIGDTVARDKLLDTDPPADHRPDLMYDFVFFSTYLRWTF